jgi:RHS repeat-associated protein
MLRKRVRLSPNSNLFEQDYPNTTIAALTYNAADQLTGITDSLSGINFLSFTYGRDNVGQLASDTPKSYGYDTINRLQTYTNSNTTTYGYDHADRLTSTAISGGGNNSALAYDNGDQLQSLTVTNGVTQISKTTYGFDAKGNRTSASVQGGSTTTLGYDQANRLVGYGAGATYAYDGDGLRMNKAVSGSSEAFTWDVADGLPLVIQDGNTAYVTGPSGLPLEQVNGSTIYYFHHDQLGSTRGLTDSTGSVQQTYDFDPYGNPTASTGSLVNPSRYGGQYVDSESGLYYLRARSYDPVIAQFISADPAFSLTRERYQYADGNPANHTDPGGLYTFGACLSGAIAAGLRIALQFCAVLVINTKTGHMSGGITATQPVWGGDVFGPFNQPVPQEIGTPSVGFSATIQQSNANRLSELAGPFVIGGASGGPITEEGGLSTTSSCGRKIGFAELGYTRGFPLVEAHVGISTTSIVRQFGSDG